GLPFMSLSFGLGFRVIPALGACARQFQPAGFRFPLADWRLAFCKNTNNPLLNLRKTASLAWRAASFAPGRPNQLGHERKTNTCFAKIASLSLVFLGQDAESRSTPNGNKLAEWAGTLQKGAYIKVEGELRYREYTPAESDRSVRVAEIHANSI